MLTEFEYCSINNSAGGGKISIGVPAGITYNRYYLFQPDVLRLFRWKEATFGVQQG